MKKLLIILLVFLLGCNSNQAPDRDIEKTIQQFLVAVQKQDGEDELDYTKLSSFIITKEEYSDIQSRLDFKNFEDYQENLGDELADVFIESEEIGLDFSKISKIKFTSIWEDEELVHDGLCTIKFKDQQEVYEMDVHAIKTDSGWKIIFIEDLGVKDKKIKRGNSNEIKGEE